MIPCPQTAPNQRYSWYCSAAFHLLNTISSFAITTDSQQDNKACWQITWCRTIVFRVLKINSIWRSSSSIFSSKLGKLGSLAFDRDHRLSQGVQRLHDKSVLDIRLLEGLHSRAHETKGKQIKKNDSAYQPWPFHWILIQAWVRLYDDTAVLSTVNLKAWLCKTNR